MSSEYSVFLNEHKHNKQMSTPHTHTRMSGGSFQIPDDKLNEFYKLYKSSVFGTNPKTDSLTEKQHKNGITLLDFDFKYNISVTERVHTMKHCELIINTYLIELFKHVVIDTANEANNSKKIYIYVMEKPHVNMCADKNYTKDGIHIVIPIKVPCDIKKKIRKSLIKTFPNILSDLNTQVINKWDDIYDKTIVQETTNWTLYGSRKPDNEAYALSAMYSFQYAVNDNEDGEKECEFSIVLDKTPITPELISNHFNNFVARTENFITTSLIKQLQPLKTENMNVDVENDDIMMEPIMGCLIEPEPENTLNDGNKKTERINTNLYLDDTYVSNPAISNNHTQFNKQLHTITSYAKLEVRINQMLLTFKNEGNTESIEAHEYVTVLGEKYYADGSSHAENRGVAFALKNTNNKLFLSWVYLRSKSDTFKCSEIPQLHKLWNDHFNINGNASYTVRSLRNWAFSENRTAAEAIYKKTKGYYIKECILDSSDCSIARLLHYLHNDKYVCVGKIDSVDWYTFRNHRWERDQVKSLRKEISASLESEFIGYKHTIKELMIATNPEDKMYGEYKHILDGTNQVLKKIKSCTGKNTIMREVAELLYDPEFLNKVDINNDLLGCANGIYDFKTATLRPGVPDDFVTKSCLIPYIKYVRGENKENDEIADQINDFFRKLFPVEELHDYMWDHMSTLMHGGNHDNTFHVYLGSGSNGKSMLDILYKLTFGEYRGTYPTSLLFDKDVKLGGTCSELFALKNVRLAGASEPGKNAVLNDGRFKLITGGDDITVRELFSTSENFSLKCDFTLGTNVLFDVLSNDDGTWRRIRLIDFMSKFVGEKEKYKNKSKFIYPKDLGLEKKMKNWSPVFLSMLLEKYDTHKGNFRPCDIVTRASNKYRDGQDKINSFINECIEEKISPEGTKNADKSVVTKTLLNATFKKWHEENYGKHGAPKSQELYDELTTTFGNFKSNKWFNICIKDDNEIDELENEVSNSAPTTEVNIIT